MQKDKAAVYKDQLISELKFSVKETLDKFTDIKDNLVWIVKDRHKM